LKFTRLEQWLEWQQSLHPSVIELGLERIAQVWRRLEPGDRVPRPVIITVAGTNGKGSTVAILESILRQAGYRTAAYTSPHLLKYNERIRCDGRDISDAELMDAFARVEDARCGVALTYFEYGTLAAFHHLLRQRPRVLLLEVGLGGRLDAVNLLDPDVSMITGIALDHCQWLGDSLASIAAEKAGIMRPDRTAVLMQRSSLPLLAPWVRHYRARAMSLGEHYRYQRAGSRWHWQGLGAVYQDLPLPALIGDFQLDNAAGALAALDSLKDTLPVTPEQVAEGLLRVSLPGRMQVLRRDPLILLDVAHNPQAADTLAENLAKWPCRGRRLACFSMLADKDLAGLVTPLIDRVDHWYLSAVQDPRAMSLDALVAGMDAMGVAHTPCPLGSGQALALAFADLTPADQLLVFGTFGLVGRALADFAQTTF
jgi:dihydrofolate synthase/folylpolyglutamate synthase